MPDPNKDEKEAKKDEAEAQRAAEKAQREAERAARKEEQGKPDKPDEVNPPVVDNTLPDDLPPQPQQQPA